MRSTSKKCENRKIDINKYQSMKHLMPLTLVAFLFLFLSCNKDDDSNEPSSIQIGNYIFNFETKFTLVELQGIDSYVGKINGSGISISVDYGWYTSPANNLSENEYLVTEDEINGHYIQIVKPVDSETNYTRIHLFKISDSIGGDVYNSLSMYTNNLNAAEQEMIIKVFNNVEIIE